MLTGKCFQTGSYARYTANSPVHDLDIIWKLPEDILKQFYEAMERKIDPYEINIKDSLYKLAEQLDEEYRKIGENVTAVPQSHSVCLEFGDDTDGFSIDLVPGVPQTKKNEYSEKIFKVPEIAHVGYTKRSQIYKSQQPIKWILSDPKGYIKDALELNNKNNSFRKTVKFLKAWKRGCNKEHSEFKLKSFHIELIINEIYKSKLHLDTYGASKIFFNQLPEFIKNPRYKDRANEAIYIDQYIQELNLSQKELLTHFVNEGGEFIESIEHYDSAENINAELEKFLKIQNKYHNTPYIETSNKNRKPYLSLEDLNYDIEL